VDVSESILSKQMALFIRELLAELLDFLGRIETSEVDIATLYSTRVVKEQADSAFRCRSSWSDSSSSASSRSTSFTTLPKVRSLSPGRPGVAASRVGRG
jgi:hypothetical protein